LGVGGTESDAKYEAACDGEASDHGNKKRPAVPLIAELQKGVCGMLHDGKVINPFKLLFHCLKL